MKVTLNEGNTLSPAASHGLKLGGVIAVCISWSLHKSILWCILHGLFGWFYVIYYAITTS